MACSTFCQGVTAPPAGSTIRAVTPDRLAASTSVSSLSPSMAVSRSVTPALAMARRSPLGEGFWAWPT